MSAGRPLEGAKPKQRVSITVDPDEWKEFRDNVTRKMPPGTSASSHIQEFIRKENARLKGEKAADNVDVLGLQK